MEKPGLGPKKQHPEETSSGHPSGYLENNNAGDSRKIGATVRENRSQEEIDADSNGFTIVNNDKQQRKARAGAAKLLTHLETGLQAPHGSEASPPTSKNSSDSSTKRKQLSDEETRRSTSPKGTVKGMHPLFLQHRKLVGTVAPAVVTDSKQVLDTASETGNISSLQGSKPSPSPEHGRDEASSDESTVRSVVVTDTASPPCGEAASMDPGAANASSTKSSPQRQTEVPPASINGTAVPSTDSTPGTEAASTDTRPWTHWEEVFEEDLKSLAKIFAVNEELAPDDPEDVLGDTVGSKITAQEEILNAARFSTGQTNTTHVFISGVGVGWKILFFVQAMKRIQTKYGCEMTDEFGNLLAEIYHSDKEALMTVHMRHNNVQGMLMVPIKPCSMPYIYGDSYAIAPEMNKQSGKLESFRRTLHLTFANAGQAKIFGSDAKIDTSLCMRGAAPTSSERSIQMQAINKWLEVYHLNGFCFARNFAFYFDFKWITFTGYQVILGLKPNAKACLAKRMLVNSDVVPKEIGPYTFDIFCDRSKLGNASLLPSPNLLKTRGCVSFTGVPEHLKHADFFDVVQQHPALAGIITVCEGRREKDQRQLVGIPKQPILDLNGLTSILVEDTEIRVDLLKLCPTAEANRIYALETMHKIPLGSRPQAMTVDSLLDGLCHSDADHISTLNARFAPPSRKAKSVGQQPDSKRKNDNIVNAPSKEKRIKKDNNGANAGKRVKETNPQSESDDIKSPNRKVRKGAAVTPYRDAAMKHLTATETSNAAKVIDLTNGTTEPMDAVTEEGDDTSLANPTANGAVEEGEELEPTLGEVSKMEVQRKDEGPPISFPSIAVGLSEGLNSETNTENEKQTGEVGLMDVSTESSQPC
jgi:hypothetical protein